MSAKSISAHFPVKGSWYLSTACLGRSIQTVTPGMRQAPLLVPNGYAVRTDDGVDDDDGRLPVLHAEDTLQHPDLAGREPDAPVCLHRLDQFTPELLQFRPNSLSSTLGHIADRTGSFQYRRSSTLGSVASAISTLPAECCRR